MSHVVTDGAATEIELAERWFDEKYQMDWTGWLAESTVESYTREVGRWLTSADILGFATWPVESKNIVKHIDRLWEIPGTYDRPTSPRTVMKAIAALDRIVKVKRDVKPDLPIVMSQKVKDKIVEYEVRYSRARFAARQADEIPLAHLLAMQEHIDRNTLKGRRDACAFTLAIGMGCRAAELVGIDIHPVVYQSHIRAKTDAGDLPIWIPRAKNDRKGKGRMCYVEPVDPMPELCPHVALEDWLEALDSEGYREGPLFFSMRGKKNPDRWPTKLRRYSRSAFSTFVTQLAVKAGLPEGMYSAHSLRRTAIRMMRRGGADLDVIADHVGHASTDTTRLYTGTVAYEDARQMSDGFAYAMKREGLTGRG